MKINFDMNRRSEEATWNINGETVIGRQSNRASGQATGSENDVKALALKLAEVLKGVPDLKPIADGLVAAANLPSVGNLGTYSLSISLREDLPEVEATSSYRAADMSAANGLLPDEEEVEDED